jgi:uncharacterized protein (TIGR03067 family)
MIRHALAVVLLTASLAAAGDADTLKGKWTAKVGPNEDIEITIEFQDKAVLVTVPDGNGGEIQINGEYILDEKATPKKIDFIKFSSPDGGSVEDNLGIYQLNEAGDEVKICTGGPGQDRPDAFVPQGDGGRGTITLKKKK